MFSSSMYTQPLEGNKFNSLWHLVGNTPMVEITYEFKNERRSIFAKCEFYNATGSIKDRMALYILQKAYEEERLKPDDIIVEVSSGNTGISIAALGRQLGHHVIIVMPDTASVERFKIIESFGAEVIGMSQEQGGFLGSLQLADELARIKSNVFLPRQFENRHNVDVHSLTTGTEIWKQLQMIGRIPDAFVAGVGTGGTVMGVGRYLKTHRSSIKVHPLEPFESPTLSTGFKVGRHRIQGISDEFIPKIVKLDELDPVISVHDGDSILVAQKLATQLGLAVGISSGCNFLGAVKVQNELKSGANVVTVFPDSNKKYLSTDLVKKEPQMDEYLAKHIKFISYKPISRVQGGFFNNIL